MSALYARFAFSWQVYPDAAGSMETDERCGSMLYFQMYDEGPSNFMKLSFTVSSGWLAGWLRILLLKTAPARNTNNIAAAFSKAEKSVGRAINATSVLALPHASDIKV